MIGPCFQGLNRPFVLSFENNDGRAGCRRNSFTKVEIKDYNVMVNGKKVFDQPGKNDLRAYDNIQKTAASQVDD